VPDQYFSIAETSDGYKITPTLSLLDSVLAFYNEGQALKLFWLSLTITDSKNMTTFTDPFVYSLIFED
jgi:hypothetical protein